MFREGGEAGGTNIHSFLTHTDFHGDQPPKYGTDTVESNLSSRRLSPRLKIEGLSR
jgi:hypothetical protein